MSALSVAPVVLILGGGSNIGSHIARTFAAKGYKVAVSARSNHDDGNTTSIQYLRNDLADPNSVLDVFAKVREALGHPSVVVYNGESPSFRRKHCL